MSIYETMMFIFKRYLVFGILSIRIHCAKLIFRRLTVNLYIYKNRYELLFCIWVACIINTFDYTEPSFHQSCVIICIKQLAHSFGLQTYNVVFLFFTDIYSLEKLCDKTKYYMTPHISHGY